MAVSESHSGIALPDSGAENVDDAAVGAAAVVGVTGCGAASVIGSGPEEDCRAGAGVAVAAGAVSTGIATRTWSEVDADGRG